ncbi:MAG TPA: ATP-binding protein [Deltaproteobacteria bacterium]|nr:ATP-binding protein [Deltaproteobacteria bacterium]HQI02130.1 ATP-binding protein [Deltaproteobacteria bacterium]
MKKPIIFKLFISYLLLILVLSGIILAFVFHAFSTHALDTATGYLQRLGSALEYTAKPLLEQRDISSLNSFIRKVGSDTSVRITVIDRQGVVMADSEHASASMENHRSRPEVASAMNGEPGRSTRYSTTLHHDMLYIALPMRYGNQESAVMRLSMPIENLDPLLARVKKHTLELASIIIVSSLLVALLFSHIISTPIRKLGRASKRLALGEFKTRVPLHGDDEIQELSRSFNEMAENLEKSFAEVSSSKEELESIISSMKEGLIVIDSEGRILLMNKSAQALIDSGKAAGRHYWELIRSPKLNSLVDEAAKAPLTGEISLDDKSYLCSITPIRTGREKIVILHDVTEMRRLEDIKKDLVVNVSHELRTPLTAIKGFTETMLEERSDHDREYLEIIKRHTDRLMNIINDLIDLSELEAGETAISCEDINARNLIEGVLAMFSQKIKAKNLKAGIEEADGDILIRGDPFRLEQLIINLVDNAVKYTEQGGITIRLEKTRGDVIIRISDTGIGIPKEHLGRIFERFYVVDKSRSRKLGGTGLGLAIVKHIVTLHKGTISVSSKPYGGTTFTVAFPQPA